MQVRRDKCMIGAPEVEFNGHRLSAGGGLLPLLSNVEELLKIAVPTKARQLVRFLATAAY
jgi:hypothetical protein